MSRSNEYSLAGALERFMEDSRLKDAAIVHRVCHEWAAYVGEVFARHTESLAFKSGTLFVRIGHPAWRHEFQFLTEAVKRKINDEAGKELCKEIRYF
jgi:predicted nucleic acid-binding Zn ribbon protein